MSETPEPVEPAPVIDPEVDRDWDNQELGSMADFADDTEPELEEGNE